VRPFGTCRAAALRLRRDQELHPAVGADGGVQLLVVERLGGLVLEEDPGRPRLHDGVAAVRGLGQ
jgi:hypothetical protein